MYYFFFIPIGTDVERRGAPLATLILAAVNLLVFLLLQFAEPTRPYLWRLAMVPADPSLATAFGACFLHGGWLHLGGNLLYLLLFGAPLEDRLGRLRFLAVYLLGGAAALYVQAAVVMTMNPHLGIYPIIGASGSVSALLGAFLVRLPGARVRVASIVMFLLHGVHRASVRALPAVAAIALWMLLQLVYGLVAGGGPGVAYWAHLGGLVIGAALALALGARRGAMADLHRRRGKRYLEEGAYFAAAGEYEALVRLEPDDPQVLRLHGRALVAAGARRRACDRFETAIERFAAAGDQAAATATYLEMERLLPGICLEPDLQLAIARRLLQDGEFEPATAALEDFVRAYPDHPDAEVGRLLIAEIRQLLSGPGGDTLRLWREVDPRRLPPAWRRHLARRLDERRVA
jgi:membrane associated rhomboid family serine protease